MKVNEFIEHRKNPAEDDLDELKALQEYLVFSFPKVHKNLQLEMLGNHRFPFLLGRLISVYYTLGRERNQISSHSYLQDTWMLFLLNQVRFLKCVFVNNLGTEGKWTHPPFEGRIADGYIWGRGYKFLSNNSHIRNHG